MSTQAERETIEGYVVDIACVRKYPRDELLERAREHSKTCALMGHCVESGYALVSDDDRLRLLDTKATPKVVEAVGRSSREKGVQLRVMRQMQEKEMETQRVEEI